MSCERFMPLLLVITARIPWKLNTKCQEGEYLSHNAFYFSRDGRTLQKISQILKSIISTCCQHNTITFWSPRETPKNSERQGQTLRASRYAVQNRINLWLQSLLLPSPSSLYPLLIRVVLGTIFLIKIKKYDLSILVSSSILSSNYPFIWHCYYYDI